MTYAEYLAAERLSDVKHEYAAGEVWAMAGGTSEHGRLQANVMRQIAKSGARFAITTGDNGYPAGSQGNYGDLHQTGADTSAVFGSSFWPSVGGSLALFPAIGNHDVKANGGN